MVAAEEDIRDGPAVVFGGTGVLGVFEEAVGERFVLGRGFVAEGVGDVARDGIDEDHGGEFAAGEDVIADGDFEVDAVFDEALVDAFVAATDDDEARVGREFADEGIIEAAASGRHVDDVAGAGVVEGAHVLEGGIEDIDAHDHALAAAERVVVDRRCLSVANVANVVIVDVEEPVFAGAS